MYRIYYLPLSPKITISHIVYVGCTKLIFVLPVKGWLGFFLIFFFFFFFFGRGLRFIF